MYRIKVFYAESEQGLENAVNNWLELFGNITILNIVQSTAGFSNSDGEYSQTVLTILYE